MICAKVNVTCRNENRYEEWQDSFDQVAHLKYKSKLTQLGLDLEELHLSETKIIVHTRSEMRVFGGFCPFEVCQIDCPLIFGAGHPKFKNLKYLLCALFDHTEPFISVIS